MKNPNRKTSCFIFIVLISFTFAGCIFDSEDENMVRRYKIVTYDGLAFDEFLILWSGNHPLEIELTRYPPQERFKGRVKIMKYGWLSIDENASGINKFEVPGRGKFGNIAQKIIFARLEIKENDLTGIYVFYHDRAEFRHVVFSAKRMY